MTNLLTTKPGDKYRSLKRPDVYEALRRQGYSKQRAARISNAMARRSRTKANYGARAGQVIAGRLVRGGDGRFSSGGESPAKTPPSKLHVTPRDTPKKPARGRRGRKPAKTEAQRDQERQAKRQQREAERAQQRQEADQAKRTERDRILTEAGLDKNLQGALIDARDGNLLTPANGEKLSEMGLAEQGRDGTYRLTASGRAIVDAAMAGDAGRVRDTLGAAGDRRAAAQERQTAAEQRRAAAEARRQRRSGGGGDKKPVEAKPARRTARQPRSSAPVRTVGGSGGSGSKRPRQERQKPQTDPVLRDAAQAVIDGTATEAQQEQLIRAGLARRDREGKISLTAAGLRATQKAFFVLKDARGTYRWVALSSNAYRDRDGEIVSTKALEADCARADRDGSYGPLRWWHVGAPVGKGWDLGQCDFNAMHGRMLIESGTFHSAGIGHAVAKAAPHLQLSIGFIHDPSEPDRDGVFHHIRRFERSLVPTGRAANPFTRLIVKETSMDKEKETSLKTLLGDAVAQQVLAGAEQTQKDIDAKGVAFKSDELADPWQAVVAALKAALAPEPVIEKADPPAIAKDGGEGDMEVMVEGEPMAEEEPLDDPEQPTLSAGDFKALDALFTAKIAPLAGLLDMEKKMTGHVQSLLGQYQQTKAAADTERAQELATLKTTIEQQETALKEAQQRLAALEGDVPSAFGGYRASQDTRTVVTKDQATALGAPQQDPAQPEDLDPFADIRHHLFGPPQPAVNGR